MRKANIDFNTINAFEEPNDENVKQLYLKLGSIVIGHVINNSGTKQEGEDVFKEAFMSMCDNVNSGKYVEMGKADEYFVRTATNVWKEQLRRKKKNTLFTKSKNEHLQIDSKELTIEQQIVKNEDLNSLREALIKLDEACRELFSLHYYLEMSFVDIGIKLNVKPASVRKRHFDCKRKMKALLINF